MKTQPAIDLRRYFHLLRYEAVGRVIGGTLMLFAAFCGWQVARIHEAGQISFVGALVCIAICAVWAAAGAWLAGAHK